MTKKLAEIEISVDRLHMKGHTDKWCIENCHPDLFPALKDVSQHNQFTRSQNNVFVMYCNYK